MGRPPKPPIDNPDRLAKKTWPIVHREMVRQGVSRAELREYIAVSVGAMSEWSRHIRAPGTEPLVKAAAYLRIPLSDLFGPDLPPRASDKMRKVSDDEGAIIDLMRRSKEFREAVRGLYAHFSPKKETAR